MRDGETTSARACARTRDRHARPDVTQRAGIKLAYAPARDRRAQPAENYLQPRAVVVGAVPDELRRLRHPARRGERALPDAPRAVAAEAHGERERRAAVRQLDVVDRAHRLAQHAEDRSLLS